MNDNKFSQWAILELMGHRKLGGLVSEEIHFGAGLIRIDVPTGETEFTTQFYSPSSLYCLTPVDEATARAFAARNQPTPVQPWELKTLPAAQPSREEIEEFFSEPEVVY